MTLAEASRYRSSSTMSPAGRRPTSVRETTLRLARDSDRFIGIKEASTDMMQGMQILKHRPDGFQGMVGR